MKKQDRSLTTEEKHRVKEEIKSAELKTSGEIRIFLETSVIGDPLDRAAYIFKILKMHKTRERNGILIYLAHKSRKFAIIGDAGINAVVPPDFWDNVKDKMTVNLEEGKIVEALVQGVRMAGEQMKTHFPRRTDDINELPDEIVFAR